MTQYATWLADVLRSAGMKVVEQPGWKTRGHGPMDDVKGVLCHHTASSPKGGNAPALTAVQNGRPDLSGPLAQLVLGRDGTYFVVAAGKCYHAGPGSWKGLTAGNSNLIGIEAENSGDGKEPWPAVQMDAYRRGCAAILKHIGQGVAWLPGHKEWAPTRKIDPNFDMNGFRTDVGKLLK